MRRAYTLISLLFLSACGPWDQAVEIPVVAAWGDDSISCQSEDVALTDLRFYVSNLQLVDTDGNAHDVRYATEFEWQNDAVALIDLEDGEGECLNGTAETFDRLLGVARAGDYKGLRFTIGVPFRLNHTNPLTASPPLDDSDMHWHWRSGYKFLRAGITTGEDGFWIHAGSAGCEGTVGHITGCTFPNRIEVYLPDFVPGRDTVAFNLKALIEGTNLADDTPSDCSSGPPETACVAPFAALGIDHSTGEPSTSQSVFRVQ